jgi:hypothetical protein
MHVGPRATSEAIEKVMHQFGLQIAHQSLPHLGIDHSRGAPAEINRRQPQGFIHRHDKVSGAQNSPLRSQRLVKSLAEHDADVFHGVVLIDVKIALCLQLEIETSMPGKQFQHVIEEAYARGHFVLAVSIDDEDGTDHGFIGFS